MNSADTSPGSPGRAVAHSGEDPREGASASAGADGSRTETGAATSHAEGAHGATGASSRPVGSPASYESDGASVVATVPPEEVAAEVRAAVTEEQRIQDDIPWGVRIAAAWSWRIIIILIFAGVLFWLFSFVSLLIIPLMIAALLAPLLMPLHRALLKIKFPRVVAAITSILTLIAGVVGLLYLVGQEIIQGFAAMSSQVTEGVLELLNQADSLAREWGINISTDQLDQWLSEAQSTLEDNASAILGGAMTIGTTAGNIMVGLILALFTLIFFLSDGHTIWNFLVKFVPGKHRPAIHGAGRRGWTALGSYIRIQVFVAAVDAIGIGVGAALLGVPLALPVAVLVFLGSFIPIVGAVVTGAVAVLLALVAQGFITAVIMLGVVLLVQQVESNILQPIVMGKAVKLHPLAVVLAVTAGTTLLGIVGALFAVPVLAFINRATQYLVKEEWRHDEQALEMERNQREESVKKAAQREVHEAQEQATMATLKERIQQTVPGLNLERRHGAKRAAAAAEAERATGNAEADADKQGKTNDAEHTSGGASQ